MRRKPASAGRKASRQTVRNSARAFLFLAFA